MHDKCTLLLLGKMQGDDCNEHTVVCLSIQCVVAHSGTAYIACYFVNRKARR